jgi:WD40 repeat protein
MAVGENLDRRDPRERDPWKIMLADLPRDLFMRRHVCQIMDVDTGKVVRDLRIAGTCSWLDWHPGGETLAACTDQGKIYLVNSKSGKQVLPPLEVHKGPGRTCCFSHSGDWLVSTDWGRILRVWDTRTGQQLLTQEHAAAVLQFSPDDTLIGPFGSGTVLWLLRCYPNKGLRIVVTGASGYFAELATLVDNQGRSAP